MQHVQVQYSPRQLLESARRAEVEGNVDLAEHIARYVFENFAGTAEAAAAHTSLTRLGYRPQEQAYGGNGHGINGNGRSGYGSNGHAPAAYGGPSVALRTGNGHSVPPATSIARAPAVTSGASRAMVPAPLPAPAPAPHASSNGHGYNAYMHKPVQTIAANFAPAAPYRAAAAEVAPVDPQDPELPRRYRAGRAIAKLTYTAGWSMILSGLLSPVPVIFGLIGANASLLGISLVAGALVAGGVLALLGGQTAMAMFDQADALRELVELERTR